MANTNIQSLFEGFEGCSHSTRDEDLMLMVEKGEIDPNALNAYGNTLLINCICQNNENMVKFLLDHGADSNLQYRNTTTLRGTPLFFAFNYGSSTSVPDRKTKFPGFNSRQMKIVNLLLEAGADPNLKDDSGESFADFFEEFKENRVTDAQVSQIEQYIGTPGINTKSARGL